MRIENDLKLGFKDVLIKPKRTILVSRKDVDIERTFIFKHSNKKWSGVPIVSSNMDTIGTLKMYYELKKQKMLTVFSKHLDKKEIIKKKLDKDFFSFSIGIRNVDKKEIKEIYKDINFLCIDIANGYSQKFINFVEEIRNLLPETIIIAGNVVTPETTEQLILSGADIVKIGIGNGSVCETRVKTGVGYPQLSAIIECADAAHGLKGLVMSDGGCNNAGDIVKAFGAGSDFVMLGGLLSGHDENKGKIIKIKNKKYKVFYGMSSEEAMKKYYGGVDKYKTSEGKSVYIPYKGKVENTLLDITGGLRSGCSYVGAESLKELSKRTTFIRVTEQENKVYENN